MRVIISGKSVHISDREREYVEKKLQKLARYFNVAREAHFTRTHQKNWQIVEVQLDLDGYVLRAECRDHELFAAIDGVADKLDEQVRRFKSKIRSHRGKADAPTVAGILAEIPEEEEEANVALPVLARRKQVQLKPMSEEEASLQLDLLNHDFFAFLNASTGQVNVLYRRRDGDNGLLELEA